MNGEQPIPGPKSKRPGVRWSDTPTGRSTGQAPLATPVDPARQSRRESRPPSAPPGPPPQKAPEERLCRPPGPPPDAPAPESPWSVAAPLIAATAALVVLWLTARQPPGVWVLAHYVALVVASLNLLLLAAQFVGDRWERAERPAKWSAWALTVLVVLLWIRFDWYPQKWTNANGYKFKDLHHRWSGDIYYREFHTFDGGFLQAEGPMTASEKPHGHWRFMTLEKTDHVWFWYGQPVEEGEWHLRERL